VGSFSSSPEFVDRRRRREPSSIPGAAVGHLILKPTLQEEWKHNISQSCGVEIFVIEDEDTRN
jgi:hypothetical protein